MNIGSMPCLDTLVLTAFTWCCRLNITIHIYACKLSVLCVANVNVPSPLAPAKVYSLIGILPVLLGRKLQLISLVHGQHQHHMVLWNSLLSLVLTPLLILPRSHRSLWNLAAMFLPILSSPGFLGILDQYESFMTMGASLQTLLSNKC